MEAKASESLNDNFVKHVSFLANFCKSIKEEFEEKEKVFISKKQEEAFLDGRKDEIFITLDNYFDEIWNDFEIILPEDFQKHKQYYIKEMMEYIGTGIETNTYIRMKPLGYAGDYVTMNYIYDYHGDKYLGNNLYSRLINKYTCAIDVAKSNIFRKEYLKAQILKCYSETKNPRILSIGCGPAREIIELLKEKRLKDPIDINLLDLEKHALDFVNNELEKIDFDKKKILINVYKVDLLDIVKNKKIALLFKDVDFVYVSGVFDYLSDRISRRVAKSIFDITKGRLVIFNMSLENARHRAYYEVFGDWIMTHRKKEEIQNWTNGFVGNHVINIQNYKECKSYWVLEVDKK